MTEWRVIFHPPQDGPTNMAIDQAIMEAVGRDDVPPTLRFYAWQPACLSLGYAQQITEVDFERVAKFGWDVVRRPTGGKAILHTDELTYSVAMREDNPIVAGGIIASYRRLSAALLGGLETLHVAADITSHEEAGKAVGPVCFEVPSEYEVTAYGKKLIGSAQVRRQKTMLQHGTLPLYGDVTRICDALYFDSDHARAIARQRVASRATTVEEALGHIVEWPTVAQALCDAFADTFDLTLVEGALTPREIQNADSIRETVYTHPDWTQRH